MINLLELQARRMVGGSDSWIVGRFECIGYPVVKVFELVGCNEPPPFKSGPRKGMPNWKAKDKTSVRTVHITPAEKEAFEKEWERETGNCSRCTGDGKLPTRWSLNEGTVYKPCDKCNATGRAVALPR